MFEDESEVKGYVHNQHLIMENQKLIMERLGIECASTLEINSKDSVTRKEKSSHWHVITLSLARYVRKFILFMRERIKMSKLKSRKFWIAVVGAVLVILNDGLDLGIDNETVMYAAGILITWILGESAVDTVKKSKSDSNEDTFLGA